MPINNADTTSTPAVDVDTRTDLRVDCYVRASIPPAVTGTVNDVVERLRHLGERGLIADHRVVHWPPETRSIAEPADDSEQTRDDLVTEFERWATRHGHSLEPAFRRQQIPSAPFDLGSEGPSERVRVPLVALAIHEDETETELGAKTEAESLRGVIPYTERPRTDDSRTYTVREWLSIVEPSDRGRDADRLAHPSGHERPTTIEGRR